MGRRSLLAVLIPISVLASYFALPAAMAATTRDSSSAAAQGNSPASANPGGPPVVSAVAPDAGPVAGGTKITIRGTGLATVKSVDIGGARARNVHVVSARELTAVTPAHAAGSVAVTIIARAGTSRPSAARFHYLNRPRITGMSSHSGRVTGGQVVTLKGSSLSFPKSVSFGRLRGTVLAGSTATKLRVRTPASWAGTVQVAVVTPGGTTALSAADRYAFNNPAPQSTGEVTATPSDVVVQGTDVSSVSGGQAVTSSTGVTQAPWVVTLAATATVPNVGQIFLLKPGGTAYPAGLAGTVTAVDSTANPVTITVSAAPGTLDAAVQSAQAVFSGPLSDGSSAARQPSGSRVRSVPLGTIGFGSISASLLQCLHNGTKVDVNGSLSLTLDNVEGHVDVRAGSLFSKPYVDVWVTYQQTLSYDITAAATAECTLPAAWQNSHQKLIPLGDTGAVIAFAPDAGISVSAGGTLSFQQHSYRLLGLVSNPDGSIQRLHGESSDPAQVKVSGELRVEAYAGVQVQVGLLSVVGVGMTLDGGVAGTASSDWPPQICLSAFPFLRATVYAYFNLWFKEWKLQAFTLELDLKGIGDCTGEGWHTAWQSKTDYALAVACPTNSDCFVAGRTPKYGLILHTVDAGHTWTTTTMTSHTGLDSIACADASHCIAGGNGGKIAVTSDGGSSWSDVSLPHLYSPAGVGSLACLPGGTCYATAYMTKYSGEIVYSSANNGQAWAVKTIVGDEPAAMTCLNTSSCIAVGAIPADQMALVFPAASESTRMGWTGFTTGKFPANWKSLESVGCMSVSLCYAAGLDENGSGEDILATGNFGRTWTAVPDGNLQPWAVSCPTSTTCVIGGSGPNWAQYVAETGDGGRSWIKSTISTLPPADDMFTISLACPSLGHCVAIEIGSGPTLIVVS